MNDDWEEVDPARKTEPKAVPSSPAAVPPADTEMPTGSLTLPPGAGIIQSLVGHLPYWGMARTIKACRRMIEEKGELVRATTELGKALVEHEKQKAMWENRADIIEAVRVSVLAKLDRAYAEQTDAKVAREDANYRLEMVKLRAAAISVIKETDEENRQADLYEAKRRSADAKNRFEDKLGGSDSSFRRDMQRMTENKRSYETLLKEKAADVEKYGGEEKMPDFLRAAYEQLEDKLGFSQG